MENDPKLRSFIYGSSDLIDPITDDFINALSTLNSFKLLNLQYAESEKHLFNITFSKSADDLLNFALAVPGSIYSASITCLESPFQL